MKRLQILLITAVLLLCSGNLFAWGPKGHDVIAYVAECNLTKKAYKQVISVLEGRHMMYYASWMDNIRDLPEYAHTKTWHYANVDEGYTYETMRKEPAGDVYTALVDVVAKLRDHRNMSDSLQGLYVKYLVHLVGDLHCPMHAGRLSDRGGNSFVVRWFGSTTNLHRIWDSQLIESSRKWSYTEWRENIDYFSKDQKMELTEGTIREWLDETVALCAQIYAGAEEGANYSYKYMFDYFPLLESQLRKAGYRLAAILNTVYR